MVGRRADGSPADRPPVARAPIARPPVPPPDRPSASRPVDRRPPVPPAREAVSVRTPPPRSPLPRSVPPRSGTGRPVESVRTPRPDGPLVAAPDVVPRGRRPEPEPPGRLRRFARRYGWRAYAVPVLTVVTLVTLVDVARTSPGEATGGEEATTAADASVIETPAPPSRPSVVPGPTDSAEVDVGPSQPPAEPAAQTYVEQGAGSVTVVDGGSEVLGAGPTQRFVVEIEDGIEVDGAAFARAVEDTLGDPRSWGADGRMSFQRVGASAAASGGYDFRVSLISPGSMETYCPGVGTGGYTSCRYGERAVINLARWATAVPHYGGDIATYRQYVVNHEVGHVLGNGHVDCPGAGQPAPVMVQQTLDLEGCTKNAWPHP